MKRAISTTTMIALLISMTSAQSTKQLGAKSRENQSSGNTQLATGNPVLGSGTPGRISKWTGVFGSNTFTLGDSNIYEDKFGKVGINTASPTSPLTVQGMIETTLGGLKFPDGTVQTSSATGALFSITHDSTLSGNGTSASPLGVALPLELNVGTFSGNPVLRVLNTNEGQGILAAGGSSVNFAGGDGVFSQGGMSGAFIAGRGVRAQGGDSVSGEGGIGISGNGGDSSSGNAGSGVFAFGGGSSAATGRAGDGIVAHAGFANNGAAKGLAGNFTGDVLITGALNVTGTKNFKIDHPLDPENKYLLHAAIESSEVLNIYSGNVRLDSNGEAVVQMPDWFQALNRDFRYSLTPLGAPGGSLYIAQEMADNRFKIAGGTPGVKVSWQVTGVRSDAAMLRHPFKVEEDKDDRERGYYADPEAFNQLEERGTEWARHPEMMRQLSQRRIEGKQMHGEGKQIKP